MKERQRLSPTNRASALLSPRVAAVGFAGPGSVGPPRNPRARSLVHCVAAGFAALSLTATALVLVGAPPPATAAARHTVLYAYADGGSSVPGCPDREDPARGCSLGDALSRARGGDTVALATPGRRGHYVGNWAVATRSTSALDPLTITAAPGVAGPVLDGNHGKAKGCGTRYCSGAVLVLGAHARVELRGLTIEAAFGTVNPHGGGVRNDLGGTLSVSGCTFYDDQASWGGAIDNADANGTGTLLVSASTFRSDGAAHGGAINNHGKAFVSSSVFTSDRSTNGGAIDNGDGGSLVVASSSFSANSALDDGGAIDNADHFGKGSLEVSRSTFRSNRAHDGGAIANADNSGAGTLAVEGSKFLANKSGNDGGAIDNADPVGHGTVSVSASLLSGGTAGGGGGAIANGVGSVSVSTSTLSGNQAQYAGALDNHYDYQPPGPPVDAGAEQPANSGTQAGNQAGAVANGAGPGTARLSVAASMFSGNGTDCGGADVSNGPRSAVATIWDSTFDLGDPPPSAARPQPQSSLAGSLSPDGIYFPTCEGDGAVVDNADDSGGFLWLWGSTFVNYDIPDGGTTYFIDNGGIGWAAANIFSVGVCDLGGTWHDMGYNVLLEPDFSLSGGSDQEKCVGDSPPGLTGLGNRDADVPALLSVAPKTFLGPPAGNGGPTQTVLPLRDSPALGVVPYGTVVKMDNRTIVLCPSTDQRGIKSASERACDAGAVQVPYGVAAPRVEVSALSTSYYGSVLVLGTAGESAGDAGSPLYEFSGDANGKFGCTTRKAVGYSAFAAYSLASCTGPESDFVNYVSGDEWPALTTTGKPVAGPGVDQKLLGTVERPGIGDQVTYGGHPLYLFDHRPCCDVWPPNYFDPQGEGYLESVAPMYPWHGIWWLVSAQDGSPAPEGLAVAPETLPDKRAALAYEPDALDGAAVTVYSFSLDRPGLSACTGVCAVTWPPLLTRGKPGTDPNVANNHIMTQDLGFIRRPDGTEQATYEGKPLYLYSGERYFFPGGDGPGILPSQSGTAGNGSGLRGPKGGTFSVVYLGH
jgi:predicted lipoprotein with Yx(FWY)xxD motif